MNDLQLSLKGSGKSIILELFRGGQCPTADERTVPEKCKKGKKLKNKMKFINVNDKTLRYDGERDVMWVRFPLGEYRLFNLIFLALASRQNAELSSAIQHVVPKKK